MVPVGKHELNPTYNETPIQISIALNNRNGFVLLLESQL